MKKKTLCAGVALMLLLGPIGSADAAEEQNPASAITAQKNQSVYKSLDFADKDEYENANRGFIAAPDELVIRHPSGVVVWSQAAYDFVEDAKAPDTVNPSLWRDTQLNHRYGLFKVTDGIYQVRGYDMSNLTIVEGNTGRIVIDTLMSAECSKAAMELIEQNLGKRPVKAVIVSHPHVDHYGGIKGVVSEEDVKSGAIPLIVPEGFEESAVSENLYAGYSMARRSNYQYGPLIDPSPKGQLAIGIGIGQSAGSTSYITPTDIIKRTGERRTIDGIVMEFQMTPDTEAPAEMNIYFPQKRALWLAENCTGTLHNIYTLRGAKVRDSNAWSHYILEAMTRYGNDTDVVFQSHNWPHWETKKIHDYMMDTAAAYKYIHDQTLLYTNLGDTSTEIAQKIKLPDAIAGRWTNRPYYGTVSHNAKAVYQKYMGWYDANPIHLNQLPPTEYAKKLVAYMGDTDKVLKMAKADYDRGEYQWVAEITNAIVFADPNNEEARELCADALTQLGYQAENGTWRNAYLTGAKELREHSRPENIKHAIDNGKGAMQKRMTADMLLDFLGILIDSNKAQEAGDLNFLLNLTDTNEHYLVTLRAGVLLYQKDGKTTSPDAVLTMPKAGLLTLVNKDANMQKKLIKVEGRRDVLALLTKYVTKMNPDFPIIEP